MLKNVKPPCLSQQNDDAIENTTLTVSGWGITDENSGLSDQLQAVQLSVLNKQHCNDHLKEIGERNHWNYTQTVTSEMFCAGSQNGAKDTCCKQFS